MMNRGNLNRKLAAILSTDVKGYSLLMADDDVETVKALKICRRIMAEKIAEYKGRVVDSPGDNLLSEFASVSDAVQCAVAIQAVLKERNSSLPQDRKMEFRMGVNLGDVIQDKDQIYGDGINIAARLESIAPGGGICISGSAFDQVKNLLDLGFEFQGEKSLKHIPDKIRVYRVLTDPEKAGKVTYVCQHDNPRFRRGKRLVLACLFLVLIGGGIFIKHRAQGPDHRPIPMKIKDKIMQMHLPDKPSIAVLPFMNMSQDPDQEYFSDGLTEDLITDLSNVSGIFVIARNSVFAYKGKAVKVGKIGRELGVKYVLEGSVRKVDNRVRITAQLIDAGTEGHVWAQRYDRELEDIFSVQDEVRRQIVNALSVELNSDDEKRIGRKSTIDLEAYDYYLKGMEHQTTKMKGGMARARAMFQRAVEIDPGYARAWAALGHTILMEWVFGADSKESSLEKSFELAQKAINADPGESAGYGLLANVYLWRKEHDKGLVQVRRAIGLGPGNAEWIAALGEQLIWGGDPMEGIRYIEQAMRLDPKYPAWYLWDLGHAHYLAKQYQQAVDAFERALVRDSHFWPSHAFLALAYDAMGRRGEAKNEIEAAQKGLEASSLVDWKDRLPYRDARNAAFVVRRLNELGMR